MSQVFQIIVAEPDRQYQSAIGAELAAFTDRIQAYLCKGGTEAHQAARSLGRLDLLITEAVMSDLDGINLLVNIRQFCPGLKAVVLSEYDLTDYADYLSESIILPKPFQRGQIQQAVFQLLPDLANALSTAQNMPQSSLPGYLPSVSMPSPAPVSSAPQSAQAPDSPLSGFQLPAHAKFPNLGKPGEAQVSQYGATLLNLQPGMQIGAYSLVHKLSDTEWGPCFQASQAGVNRPTRMIFYQNLGYFSAQQFRDYFTQLAAAPHPNLLTIIELGEHLGQPYVVEEMWQGRSLAEYMASKVQLDARQAAHLGEQAVGALAQIAHLPNRQITPSDILISNTGVLKIAHIHPLPGAAVATSSAQLSALANILKNCLLESARQEPGLVRLLDAMLTGAISFEQTQRAFRNLQIELAPVAQTKETHEAREVAARLEKDNRSKKFGLAILILIMLSTTLTILAFLYREQLLMLLSPGGKDFSANMQRIPAGVVQMEMQDPDDPENTIFVPISTQEFWIDTYETTIYEYSLFLNAIRKREVNPADIMHPDTPERQRDFTPDDWPNILKAATSNTFYRDIKLSPNTPIFNVSFYDAYAYAKWKGKRLPTADEWLKAARGPQGYAYPWGNSPDESAANTGVDYSVGRPDDGGKIDGFHGPAPVNDPRMDRDRSPFGVRLMFGNVSEWTSTPGGISLGQQRLRIMGNSYTSLRPNPLSHRSASPIIPSTRNAITGFRLVSDTAPQEKR